MSIHQGTNLYPQQLTEKVGDFTLELDVPEGVWNPTLHGRHLANTILELDFEGQHVLELGSGCGNHTILIAKRNPAGITVTEIDQKILNNTRHNVEKHGITLPISYRVADWTNLPANKFDVMITNPPFAKSGKRYFRYFIDTFINESHKLVWPGGRIIFIQSSMANVSRSIQLMESWDMEVRIVAETMGPFRHYYLEDDHFMKYIESFPNAYYMINGEHHEKLTVFEATLPDWLERVH